MLQYPGDAITLLARAVLLGWAFLVTAPADSARQPCAAPQDVVVIGDPGLRKAIQRQLGLPKDAAVTCGGMEELRELIARDSNIGSLAGVEHATQLERLDCGRNKVVDLTPLTGLRRLRELRADRNLVADLTPLLKSVAVGQGFRLDVARNCLDVSDGSAGRHAIDALLARGVDVEYRQQKKREDCTQQF